MSLVATVLYQLKLIAVQHFPFVILLTQQKATIAEVLAPPSESQMDQPVSSTDSDELAAPASDWAHHNLQQILCTKL